MYLAELFQYRVNPVKLLLFPDKPPTPIYPISQCTIPVMLNLLDLVEVEVCFQSSSPTSLRKRSRPRPFPSQVDLLSFDLRHLQTAPMASKLDSPILLMLCLLMIRPWFTMYLKKDPARPLSLNLVEVVANRLESMSSTVTTSYGRVNRQYIKMANLLPRVWEVQEQWLLLPVVVLQVRQLLLLSRAPQLQLVLQLPLPRLPPPVLHLLPALLSPLLLQRLTPKLQKCWKKSFYPMVVPLMFDLLRHLLAARRASRPRIYLAKPRSPVHRRCRLWLLVLPNLNKVIVPYAVRLQHGPSKVYRFNHAHIKMDHLEMRFLVAELQRPTTRPNWLVLLLLDRSIYLEIQVWRRRWTWLLTSRAS
jgi:hypothetical protein